MSLGALLKTKRIQLGLTLEEVALASGASQSYVYELERNTSEPGIRLCARLSIALGLPVSLMAAASLLNEAAK